MKLKINTKSESPHKQPVTCLGWNGIDEVYTSGDDGQLLSWNVSQNEFTKIAQLSNEILPTDLQFLTRSTSSSAATKHADVLLLTSSDGKFYIMNKNGRIERTVEGHKGAILVGQWSNDGLSLMTCGEDGFIKIWSRGGMLRSTLISSDNSIYGACWSNDSQSIVYTQGNLLTIKELTPNSVPKKWIAHDGLVLCVSWGNLGVLVSGGEDNRYKVWDEQGHQLYSSIIQDNSITSVAFSPDGDLFAVGSFNSLRLCDYYGYSKALEKPVTGCIYKLAFSIDSTQIAAACANGQVLFANILDRTLSYGNYIATITERKTVTLQDISNETIEYLELPERIIRMDLRYSNLVVTTPNQCYIYSNTNWNTPNVFDLKSYVTLMMLSQKHMLLAETNSLGIYNYQARLIASPRWPNMRSDTLKSSTVALSSDLLVVRDAIDTKSMYVMDLTINKSSTNERYTTITHSLPIVQISLDQCDDDDSSSNRKLALLDNAKDLYIIDVRSSHSNVPRKIGGHIHSFLWNSEQSFLAAIVQDTQLTVWYCPSAAHDTNLLRLSSYQYDSVDLGKSPRIEDFIGNFVHLRRADGALINVSTSPFPAILNRFIRENKWKNARCLCRTIDDRTLWTCLAVLSTQSNNVDLLEIAEEAYAEIEQYDKVFFIQEIKRDSTSKAELLAGQSLLGGSYHKAELILLQNGLIYRAIRMHMNLYNWSKALSLAIKHKSYIDVVLYKRQLFLKELDKDERNTMYLEIRDSVPIDIEKIKLKMQQLEETNVKT